MNLERLKLRPQVYSAIQIQSMAEQVIQARDLEIQGLKALLAEQSNQMTRMRGLVALANSSAHRSPIN